MFSASSPALVLQLLSLFQAADERTAWFPYRQQQQQERLAGYENEFPSEERRAVTQSSFSSPSSLSSCQRTPRRWSQSSPARPSAAENNSSSWVVSSSLIQQESFKAPIPGQISSVTTSQSAVYVFSL